MNERIQQLADRVANMMPAGVYTIHYESGQSGVEFTEDALEKFVELIVEECGVALNPPVQNRNVISRGQAYDLIKKHFGVEE